MVYPALLLPIRTPRLPVFDWTDAPRRFKWTRPFRRKTKSGFCACVIIPLVDSSWNVMAHGDVREGEVKGKLGNELSSQYPSHYLGTWCIQHYYRWYAHLGWPVVDWTDAPPGRFKWTRPFHRKKKSVFCACAITFQLACTFSYVFETWNSC